MTNRNLLHSFQADSPRFNKKIVEGYSAHDMRNVKGFIDAAINCAAKTFCEGLTYEGDEWCTPLEQFKALTRNRTNKRHYEVAKSSMFVVKYKFSYKGIPLADRFLMLPHVSRGNILMHNGVRNVASPTISDTSFSVGKSRIYMPVTRSKLNFNRHPYWFVGNGIDITADVHTSILHNSVPKNNRPTEEPMLINYLFCMKGVTKTFKEELGADIVFGKDLINGDYDRAEWLICESKENAGHSSSLIAAERMQIAVKHEEVTEGVKSAIAGFFSIMDLHGGMHNNDIDDMDDTDTWKRLLIKYTWKNYDTKAMDQIESHIESIGHYMDEVVIRKLKHEGLDITNMMDLFAYIIECFSSMVTAESPNSTYGKSLQVVPIVMLEAVRMIFNLMFQLQKIKPARVSADSIKSIFDRFWQDSKGMSFRSSNCVAPLDSATDCMMVKTTSIMIPQIQTNTSSGKLTEMSNPAFKMHSSLPLTSCYLMPNKSSPSAVNRTNPTLGLDEYGKVVIDEYKRPILEELAELFGET